MYPLVMDANSVIMRCIMVKAMSDLKEGQTFTGGVFGAIRVVRSVIGDPDLALGPVFAAFDGGVPPWRKELVPTYKEKRKQSRLKMTDEQKDKLFGQIAQWRRMLPLLGVRVLWYKAREADDVVAAAVRILEKRGHEPFVMTSDRDLLQLVTKQTRVLFNQHSRYGLVGYKNFQHSINVPRRMFLLFKLLVGDASDQLGGASGVGEVLAWKIIVEAASEIPEFKGMKTAMQLEHLLRYLRGKAKRRKCEDVMLADAERLRNELRAIDLRDSFGNVAVLKRKMAVDPGYDEKSFLRACAKLRFRSIIGNPYYYTRVYKAAWERGRSLCDLQ